MGGTKKKTLASMEKSQDDNASAAGGDTPGKKKTEKTKVVGERKKVDVLLPRMNDQELLKAISSAKAITIYGAAKALSVNASIARSVLVSLETKGMLKRVGGYSGHYVWAAS